MPDEAGDGVNLSPGRSGWGLIADERIRQLDAEGYGGSDDDRYTAEQLVRAAECYAQADNEWTPMPPQWPWKRKEWKPKDRLRNLVRAGALLAAEIDRLNRKGGGRGQG